MVADRVREYFDKRAKERQAANGGDRKSVKAKSEVENLPPAIKARDEAGAAVGVSGKPVDAARTVSSATTISLAINSGLPKKVAAPFARAARGGDGLLAAAAGRRLVLR
jgi:hypothetical protein